MATITMGNPLLSDQRIADVRGKLDQSGTMSVGGTMSATGVLFLVLLLTGWYGWQAAAGSITVTPATATSPEIYTGGPPAWIWLCALGAFGVAMVTIFKPTLAKFTAPLYAALEGVFVGAISSVYEVMWDGIVVQAVLATMGVFLAVFVMYATGIIKVTQKFVFVIVAAMVGIMLMYLVAIVASLFGADLAFYNQPTPLGIAISVGIAIIAALNLAIDFEFINQGVKQQFPKQMEWFAGFSLMVSLIWLYFTILRILALLRQR